MSRSRSWSTVVIAAGAAMLAGVQPAVAAPRGTVLDASAVFSDDEICGFPVEIVLDGEYRVQPLDDRSGRVAILPHGPFRESWSANGTTLDINFTPNLRFEPTADGGRIMTRLGLFAGVPIRGKGQLWVEAGRIRIDQTTGEVLSAAGRWPTLALTDLDGLAPVCEELS